MSKRKIIRKLPSDDSDSEDDIPLKKLATRTKKNKNSPEDDVEDSSSESDIENYLHRADKLDLKSSFFQPKKDSGSNFNEIEKKIYAGITRLSDSSSSDLDEDGKSKSRDLASNKNGDSDQEVPEITPSQQAAAKSTFKQIDDYQKKIEEAKSFVEKYKAKKKAEETKTDILKLLASGEQKTGLEQSVLNENEFHSSDFESCDSEQENWEEIKPASQSNDEPKKNIEIIVSAMPDNVRKKKEVDLLAVMKRRLNRIRKENQVFVHKVHVLCWIAHGNFVNECINNTDVMGMALSLLPSEHCYPANRTDLNYLEQILNWYRRTVQLVEKPLKKEFDLSKGLQQQISKKIAYSKNMLVYIFIAMLRSLGIRCRLVLSFQVEPYRPPASELHSLSAKPEKKSGKNSTSPAVPVKSSKSPKAEKIEVSPSHTISMSKQSNSSEKKINFGNLKKPTNKNNESPNKSDLNEPSTSSKKLNFDNLKKQPDQVKNIPEQKNVKKSNQSKSKKESLKKTEKISGKNLKKDEGAKDEGISNSPQKMKRPHSRNTSKKDENSKVKAVKSSSRHTRNTNPQSKINRNQKNTNDQPNSSQVSNSSHITVVSDESINAEPPKKKPVIKVKLPLGKKKGKSVNEKIPQLDGLDDSSSEDDIPYNILQLDGNNDEVTKKTLNLKKLKEKSGVNCPREKFHKQTESPSRSPFTSKNEDSPIVQNKKLNFHKLINEKSASSTNSKSMRVKPQIDVKNDIINLVKGRMLEQKYIDRSRLVRKRRAVTTNKSSDSDSDYAPDPIKKKHHDSEDEFMPKVKVKKRIPVKKTETGLKVISSSSDEEKKKRANNIWVEVFLESEEKWISVDVIRGQVHCVKELYNRATHPVTYVVSWDNNNYIKDVTRRYCLNFSTVTRKLRADAKWWEETIRPFKGPNTAIDREEDNDLARQQLDQPLPKSIGEYKNHPLYVLRRHLLKFEAIYPPEPATLGFIRGEPVYPRECVYTLHSRDIWLKSAKVVKPGEKPYKIVKARPKYDKLSNTVITDQLLEIFGPWQTEDYVPPTAENGVVPRNAFGNVELFKACMLPKGTVHLKLPGLNKIARRMNIDCASAIVGFDFHGGWSHPTYDGFVVCEEFQDQLIMAWELEQEEMEKREQEKIEKRVYTNWKKLIKGLLIRERLKAKYDFGQPSNAEKKKPSKGPRFCTKTKRR